MQQLIIHRAVEVHKILDKTYPAEIMFLEYENSFQLLISVILSAQTTDRQVMQVTSRLFAGYPDPESLGKADLKDIMEIIKSTGFFRVKAENIKKTAQKLSADFGGIVPDTMENLLLLPGVGRKSANVILGAVFGRPAVIVDTHFKRVTNRLGLTESSNPDKIENDIIALLDEGYRYRFSMTVNLHGRKICHAVKPECGICVVSGLCSYFGQAAVKKRQEIILK